MKNILYTIILCFLFSFSVFADRKAAEDAYAAGDYETAFREIKLLAEQGEAEAQDDLAVLYSNGRGVTQNYQEAMKWWRLAADQGYALAQFNLGLMYDEGEGVTQDYQEAVKWYRIAAEQGFTIAQRDLGTMYAKGEGVIKDMVIAHMWFNIAASNGYEDSKKARDYVESMMTSEQLAEAQKLARECIKKNYKDCG